MRRHCDICQDEIKYERSHVWANTLPQDHPLRNISAKIEFFGASRANRDQPVDVCDSCFTKWLRGIRGVLDPAVAPANAS